MNRHIPLEAMRSRRVGLSLFIAATLLMAALAVDAVRGEELPPKPAAAAKAETPKLTDAQKVTIQNFKVSFLQANNRFLQIQGTCTAANLKDTDEASKKAFEALVATEKELAKAAGCEGCSINAELELVRPAKPEAKP